MALTLTNSLIPALAVMASVTTGVAFAQNYPTRPVRVIVPFVPGGSTDIIGRTVSQKLSEAWGQPVVVDNRGGGATIMGTEIVAKAAPDGYTLLIASASFTTKLSLVEKLPYDTLADFTPITLINTTPLVMAVNASTTFQSVAEFVAHARANPGKLNYGTSSAALRVTTAAVTRELGLEVVHIPYSAGGPYIQALAAGQIDFGTAGVASAVSMGERFRVLTVTGSQRRPPYLDVPTFTELKLPPLRGTSYSINARAGTPRPILDRLHAAATRVLQQPEVKTSLANIQLEPVLESIEASAKGLADLFTLYTDTVRKAGIQPE